MSEDVPDVINLSESNIIKQNFKWSAQISIIGALIIIGVVITGVIYYYIKSQKTQEPFYLTQEGEESVLRPEKKSAVAVPVQAPTKYQNDIFSITLPDGWVADDDTGELIVASSDYQRQFSIFREPYTGENYNHTLYDLWINEWKSRWLLRPDMMITSTEKVTLSDLPALRLEYTDGPRRGYLVTTSKGGYRYTLQIRLMDDSSWKSYKSVIEKSFSTFEFNN